MTHKGVDSRVLLKRLRDSLAEQVEGQARLNKIVKLIASSMKAEVCSIYLRRDLSTLELFATEGLKSDAVHFTKLRIGQGLVGRIAQTAVPINTSDAPRTRGFRFMPETGEEHYQSFLGVAIQRLGEILGVLIVQNSFPRIYTDDEVYGLEIVAMVLAEMTELGVFTEGSELAITAQHTLPFFCRAITGNEGISIGKVLLHEPLIIIENPVADNPKVEKSKLSKAFKKLQKEVNSLVNTKLDNKTEEYLEIFEAYQMFARDKGWRKRMEISIERGLAATVAVEKEQSEIRARMSRLADPYIKDRLDDLDDLSNRLIRILTKTKNENDKEKINNAILVARNIGPGELLDYGQSLSGVILEEGSVGSHAVIVARALSIPLVVKASRILRESRNDDVVILDADQSLVHLRPEKDTLKAYSDKLAIRKQAQEKYSAIRNKAAESLDKITVSLLMNAGVMADLPSLEKSGAQGVGLYRTELQFLTQVQVPKRSEQAKHYSRILDSAKGKPVNFRTLDIGSDKVLPFMKRLQEPNPALGWRAVRVGLDRVGILRMQIQALLRASKGRPLRIIFPLVSEYIEFKSARDLVLKELEREKVLNHTMPSDIKIGAMLETPSLAFSSDKFFKEADFISVGGNDLKQFFFAADRENELVRKRYDSLNFSFLNFLENIVKRCNQFNTPLSFCGEDAGKPIVALAFTAIGIRTLSMRASSIGPVKLLLRSVSISQVKKIIDSSRESGKSSAREDLTNWLRETKAPYF